MEVLKFYTLLSIIVFIFSLFYYLYKSKLGFRQVRHCLELTLAWPICLVLAIVGDINKSVENK